MSVYNVEITENRTNAEFGKKATLNQVELNKKGIYIIHFQIFFQFLQMNISAIEQQTEDVYDKARDLERLFMKYRIDILKKDPEQLVKEVYNIPLNIQLIKFSY